MISNRYSTIPIKDKHIIDTILSNRCDTIPINETDNRYDIIISTRYDTDKRKIKSIRYMIRYRYTKNQIDTILSNRCDTIPINETYNRYDIIISTRHDTDKRNIYPIRYDTIRGRYTKNKSIRTMLSNRHDTVPIYTKTMTDI